MNILLSDSYIAVLGIVMLFNAIMALWRGWKSKNRDTVVGGIGFALFVALIFIQRIPVIPEWAEVLLRILFLFRALFITYYNLSASQNDGD